MSENQKESKLVSVSCGTKFHSDYMAAQLHRFGLLSAVYTAHPKRNYLSRVRIPERLINFLPPIFVLSYLFKKVLGTTNKISKWLDYKAPIVFDRMSSLKLATTPILITWAWSGLETIKKVQKQGGVAIVEECGSCNLYQNRLLTEEYKSLGLRFQYPTPQNIVQRELEEVRLADYILCPSKHVANSFIQQGIEDRKCIIIPYGVNLELFKPVPAAPKKEFIVLFVGTVGVRKGLIYLFKALRLLKEKHPIKCIIIGKVENQFEKIYREYSELFHHIEQVPHAELVNYYNEASVFVFPSLDEGMAYVQLEAMACGLPVICTPNSGGDSAIEDGVNGFIVPIRDPEAIAKKIELVYNNRELLKRISEAAISTAEQFTWDVYGNRLAVFIDSITKHSE